LIVALDCEN